MLTADVAGLQETQDYRFDKLSLYRETEQTTTSIMALKQRPKHSNYVHKKVPVPQQPLLNDGMPNTEGAQWLSFFFARSWNFPPMAP